MGRVMRKATVGGWSLVALMLVVGACGGTDGSDDPDGSGGGASEVELRSERPEIRREQPSFVSKDKIDTFLDVDWSSDVTKVDQMDALRDYDWQNQTYTFDADAGLNLQAGRVLVMSGLAVRRIESVDRSGGTATVQTGPATLEQAIDSGELGMDYETEFNEEMFRHSTMRFREMTMEDGYVTVGQPIQIDAGSVSVDVEGDTATYEASVGKYNYKMEFSLEGDRFQTAFNVTKGGEEGPEIRYGVSGHVDAPKHRLRAEYAEEEGLSDWAYETQGLSGELTLSISAAGSGDDGTSFPLPEPVFEFPVLIGGVIPATIEVGALLAIEAKVPDASMASVNIENTFEFGSDVGFQLAGQKMEAQSSVGSVTVQDGSLDMAAEFTSVQADMSLGFPRIGVSVAHGSASAKLQPIATLMGELTFNPVCQKADLSLALQGKYNLSIFGAIPISEGSEKFFEETETVLQKDCSDN